LISDHAQSTSLVDWDLIADTEGNAVVVFTDTRDGSDLDVFAYRVAPDGRLLWGEDGVVGSANDDFEPAPVVTEASDGDFVFVWARLPSGADGSLRLQRLAPDGTPRFPVNGVSIAAAPGESPGFCQVVPSTGGATIVSYVRDIDTFMAPRHVRCVRVEADGTLGWGPVSVYDAVSVPIAYRPLLATDGAGGAVLVWHRSQSNLYNSLLQHLDVAGQELWPHNGVLVTTTPNRYHLNPAFCYDVATGSTLVFWNEEPTNQSQFGITGQKIAADGTRAWGDGGVPLVPMSAAFHASPRVQGWQGDALVFFAYEPTAQFGDERVLAYRVDASGAVVWGPVDVATTLSTKSRLPGAIDGAGNVRMVWEDDRSGNPDVYGQAVAPDGTLGVATTSVAGTGAEMAFACSPNPFGERTTMVFARPPSDPWVDLVDVAGHRVRSLRLDPGRSSVSWDGRDREGRPLSAGVYFAVPRGSGRGEAVVLMR
jgi:hypothetical protein